MNHSPNSLMRMFGPEGNPQARNLFQIVAYTNGPMNRPVVSF